MPPRRSPSPSNNVAVNGIGICDIRVEIEHRPPRGDRKESERSEREFRVRYVFILSNKKRVKAVSKDEVWESHESGDDPALEMREISVASLKNYNKRAQSDECRVDWEAPGGAFPKLDSIWRYMWGHAQHLIHTKLQGMRKKSKSMKKGHKTPPAYLCSTSRKRKCPSRDSTGLPGNRGESSASIRTKRRKLESSPSNASSANVASDDGEDAAAVVQKKQRDETKCPPLPSELKQLSGGTFPKLDSIWRLMWGHAQHLLHTKLQGTQKKSKLTKRGHKTPHDNIRSTSWKRKCSSQDSAGLPGDRGESSASMHTKRHKLKSSPTNGSSANVAYDGEDAAAVVQKKKRDEAKCPPLPSELKQQSRREMAMEKDPNFHDGIDSQVPPPQMAGPHPMLDDLISGKTAMDEDDEELGAQIYSQSDTAKRFATEGRDDLSSANEGSAEIRRKPPRLAKGDTNSRGVAPAGPSSSTPGVRSDKCNSLDAPSVEDTCSSFDAKGGKSTRASSSRTRPKASKVSLWKQGGSEPLKHCTSKGGNQDRAANQSHWATGQQTRVTGRKLNKGERSEIWNGYVSATNSYLSYALNRELPPIYEPTEDEIKAVKLIDPLPWFIDRVDKMEEQPSLGVVMYWRTKIKNILKIPAHDKSVQDPFDTLAFKRFLNKFQRRTHHEPSNPDEVGTVKCYLTRLMSFRLNENFSERYPFEKDLVESIKGEEVLAFYREIFDESKEETTREAVKTATKAIRAKVESYGLKADYLDSEEFDAYYREFETYYMKKKRTKEAEAGG